LTTNAVRCEGKSYLPCRVDPTKQGNSIYVKGKQAEEK
jgi:hypothetical protein